MAEYFSQHMQDKFLDERIFNKKEDGYFIEIGAYDGTGFSNTKFLEETRNWKGICIEPSPIQFAKLIKNRKCICENVALFSHEKTVQFMEIEGYAETLSGILETYDSRHLKRANEEIEQFKCKKNIIDVQAVPFLKIAEKHNMFNFDLCSIDTEGSEFQILQSIDFSKVNIKCFVIENNYNDNGVSKFLQKFGYKLIAELGTDEIFSK